MLSFRSCEECSTFFWNHLCYIREKYGDFSFFRHGIQMVNDVSAQETGIISIIPWTLDLTARSSLNYRQQEFALFTYYFKRNHRNFQRFSEMSSHTDMGHYRCERIDTPFKWLFKYIVFTTLSMLLNFLSVLFTIFRHVNSPLILHMTRETHIYAIHRHRGGKTFYFYVLKCTISLGEEFSSYRFFSASPTERYGYLPPFLASFRSEMSAH